MAGIAHVELPVSGMTCAGCVGSVQELARTPGVSAATVNLATRTESVQYDESKASIEKLIAGIQAAGYSVPAVPQELAEQAETRELRRRLLIGALFAVPVFILGMTMRLPWLQLLLTLPVLAFAGRGIFADAARALRHGRANMNSLVALGAGTAFAWSAAATALGVMPVYFEAAAVIVVLVLLGRYLESGGRALASNAIRALAHLAPPTAPVLRG